MVWSSLESDRARANEDARENLKNAADSVADRIRREVVDIEVKLELFSALPSDWLAEEIGSYVATLGEEPLVVVFHSESVQAFPQRRLLYYPVLPAGHTASCETLPCWSTAGPRSSTLALPAAIC
jgi:hypothetical protein